MDTLERRIGILELFGEARSLSRYSFAYEERPQLLFKPGRSREAVLPTIEEQERVTEEFKRRARERDVKPKPSPRPPKLTFAERRERKRAHAKRFYAAHREELRAKAKARRLRENPRPEEPAFLYALRRYTCAACGARGLNHRCPG